MKCLKRNTQTYRYVTYVRNTELTDPDGFYTGESEIQYSEEKTIQGTMSCVKGKASVEMFGSTLDYSTVLVSDDTASDIDENSILWDLEDNKYIVQRISRTPNVLSIALKRHE